MDNQPTGTPASDTKFLCDQILKIIPRETFDPYLFLQNSPEFGPSVLKKTLERLSSGSLTREEIPNQNPTGQPSKEIPQPTPIDPEILGEVHTPPSEAKRGASDRTSVSSPGPFPVEMIEGKIDKIRRDGGASPHFETGFLSIPNKIVEALYKVNLSPYQWRILLSLMQRTYGRNKKSDWISLAKFAEDTGIDRRNVHRSLRVLEERELIVVCRDDKKSIGYDFQENYENWKLSSIKTTKVSSVKTPIKDEAARRKKARGGRYANL